MRGKLPSINNPEAFFKDFPKLRGALKKPMSFATNRYNCIAFAADDKKLNWWPNRAPGWCWPIGYSEEETVASFVDMFQRHLGYEICQSAEFEPGVEKIALYGKDGSVLHAAKQPSDRAGLWRSKIGTNVDIDHRLPDLEGELYGYVVCIMRRTKRGDNAGTETQTQPPE